jgi:hypothetical protein
MSNAVLAALLSQIYDGPKPLTELVDMARAKQVGNHLQGAGMAYVLNGVARITEAGRLFVENARKGLAK